MTRERRPKGLKTSFSEDEDARTESEPSNGCRYETPAGPCGDSGARVEVGGIRLELCAGHLEAVLYENALVAPPFSPRGRLSQGVPA